MGLPMDILDGLRPHCSITKDRFGGLENAHILTFPFGEAVTTIRIVLHDSSGADLAITNMTTLPSTEKRKGHGSHAIEILLRWAVENKMTHIRAVQVEQGNEPFWTKNSFVGLRNQTNDFLYQKNI